RLGEHDDLVDTRCEGADLRNRRRQRRMRRVDRLRQEDEPPHSEEVGITKRESPPARIGVELAGERLAHQVDRSPSREEAERRVRGAMARRRNRDDGPGTLVDGAEAGVEQPAWLADEVGDVGEPGSAMLLVAEDRVAACGREGVVTARRFEITPVQITGVPKEVVRPRARRVPRVAEALDPPDRTRLAAEPRERTRPHAELPDLGPPERPEKDRRRRLRCEREHDRNPTLRGLLLVLALEGLEDA